MKIMTFRVVVSLRSLVAKDMGIPTDNHFAVVSQFDEPEIVAVTQTSGLHIDTLETLSNDVSRYLKYVRLLNITIYVI
jgi:GTPase